jgi:hypothetical protein
MEAESGERLTMQHIGLQLENENGGLIDRSDLNLAPIVQFLYDRAKKEHYPWLWSIDPYGYTIFNLYQVPHVLEELKQLSQETSNTDLQTEIRKSIDFIAKISQHTYIRLIGD